MSVALAIRAMMIDLVLLLKIVIVLRSLNLFVIANK